MKTNQRINFLILLLIIGLSGVCAQTTKKERKEQREKEVKEQIIAENYKINVSNAYPLRGRAIHLTSSYSLTVRNDSVLSYLPFYGRAYNIPYGGGEGLIFNSRIDEYKMEMDKKGTAKIEFIAQSKEDLVKFTLRIFPNGSASINADMQKRDSMNFSGEVE